jgi:hypothetical protein
MLLQLLRIHYHNSGSLNLYLGNYALVVQVAVLQPLNLNFKFGSGMTMLSDVVCTSNIFTDYLRAEQAN